MSRPGGPRIRTFKPERYQDERLAGVSRDARHLYDGLTLRADDEGRGTANAALLKANVLPFDDDASPQWIAAQLGELERGGLVVLYEGGGRELYAIVSWADDQRVDRPTASKLPAPPAAIPREGSRGIASPREGSRSFSPSRAPADRTGPDRTGPDLSSPVGGEAEMPADVDRLCHLLAELMVRNDPGAKVAPDGPRWRDAARLLIDRDGRDPELVERVIRWSQADDFWRTNVLSMPKLREKFGQLVLRMTKDEGHAGGGRSKAERSAAGLAAIARLTGEGEANAA